MFLMTAVTFIFPVSPTYVEIHPSKSENKPIFLKMCHYFLTIFVTINSEWVTSPGQSNIGTKRSKVWVQQEKPSKNAHILAVNIAVLPSLSDTFTLRLSSLFKIKHPSIVWVIIFMLAIKIHQKYVPNASETNISLTSHGIFADLNIKKMQ